MELEMKENDLTVKDYQRLRTSFRIMQNWQMRK